MPPSGSMWQDWRQGPQLPSRSQAEAEPAEPAWVPVRELGRAAAARAVQAGALRRPQGSGSPKARARGGRPSLFLVGFDQKPVGIARSDIATEGPAVSRLNGVGHRTGDDLPFGVARDGGNVGFKPDGNQSNVAFDLGAGDDRL